MVMTLPDTGASRLGPRAAYYVPRPRWLTEPRQWGVAVRTGNAAAYVRVVRPSLSRARLAEGRIRLRRPVPGVRESSVRVAEAHCRQIEACRVVARRQPPAR